MCCLIPMGCLVNFQVSLTQHLRLNLVSVTPMGHLYIELGHFGIQRKINKQTCKNETTNKITTTKYKQTMISVTFLQIILQQWLTCLAEKLSTGRILVQHMKRKKTRGNILSHISKSMSTFMSFSPKSRSLVEWWEKLGSTYHKIFS